LPNVLNFALWKKKKGETEYGLGWFPLGGYVNIAGMIDETSDANKLAAEPQPWEFRSKPAWQRLIVMLGGIIVNVILGVLIFWMITYQKGNSYLTKNEVNKLGIVAYEPAQAIGLRTGDKILNISGKDFEDFNDVRKEVILNENMYYTVQRGDSVFRVNVPNDMIDKVIKDDNAVPFIEPIYPFSIERIASPSPAEKAGLKAGDKIVSFNGKSINYYHEYRENAELNKNKQVVLEIEREGKKLSVKPTLEDGILGFGPKLLLNENHQDYSLGEAFVVGSQDAFNVIWTNIQGFKKIFKGQVSAGKALSGPIGIARNMYGGVWDWGRFWLITGMLSMALAFMNLLPIPALDGGHAVVLLYEMISGKKPSDKFLERTQQVGMAILLTLMVYVLFNDAIKAIF
jgi:regulator of sigma E protease